MNTLVVINETDITPYINWKTYSIKPEDVFEEWTDGNKVKHRIYTDPKISGSFDVWLCGWNDMDADAFITLFDNATNNHVTTMAIYNQVKNSVEAIEAYCRLIPKEHKEMMNGDYFDVYTVEVQQR